MEENLAASRHVTREEFGDEWPLTVDAGTIECRPVKRVVFIAPDGTEYALNGMALNAGYPSIDPIWAANPAIPGAKISVGPLIESGLELCGE